MEYRRPLPEFLREAAGVPALQRLRGVGMHCGCQYTDFPRFRGLVPYSRFDHSLGVARILWDFTCDPVQALAGLLHDAATPVFSHVVDFLNGDHLTQESTEEGLHTIIKKDTALLAVLEKYGISPEAVRDCSRYPLADCPSPRLCADRLEYTLANAVHYGFLPGVQALYDDLVVQENEFGTPELQFTTPARALEFAQAALACGKVYVCDEDRYAMERLSRLLRKALEAGGSLPAGSAHRRSAGGGEAAIVGFKRGVAGFSAAEAGIPGGSPGGIRLRRSGQEALH